MRGHTARSAGLRAAAWLAVEAARVVGPEARLTVRTAAREVLPFVLLTCSVGGFAARWFAVFGGRALRDKCLAAVFTPSPFCAAFAVPPGR